jgi:cell division protein FtsL
MAARVEPVASGSRAGRTDFAVPAAVRAELGRRRGIGVGAFLLALVTAGAMAHVGVRMKGIEVAYDLGRERRINTELEEARRRLNIEIGMLKDPGRIVSLARDKLKMGPPAPTDIVRLSPGQVLGARPEPAPAAAKPAHPAAAAKPAHPAAAVAKPARPAAPPRPLAPTPVDDGPPAEETE